MITAVIKAYGLKGQTTSAQYVKLVFFLSFFFVLKNFRAYLSVTSVHVKATDVCEVNTPIDTPRLLSNKHTTKSPTEPTRDTTYPYLCQRHQYILTSETAVTTPFSQRRLILVGQPYNWSRPR